MTLLKGRIFWVKDDFGYTDSQERDFEHTVARIENAAIDDNLIQFSISNPGYLTCSSSVSLNREEIGTKYSGKFKDQENENYQGQVYCEVYSNEKKYFLYGQWVEEEVYTWWAIIEKT